MNGSTNGVSVPPAGGFSIYSRSKTFEQGHFLAILVLVTETKIVFQTTIVCVSHFFGAIRQSPYISTDDEDCGEDVAFP
jgi:hypothetical protein